MDDPEVMDVKEKIMEIGVVPKILAKQDKKGYWEDPRQFYNAKYKGTVWQLLILAELGADGDDRRVKNACEFIFNNSQDHDSMGFSIEHAVKLGGGRKSMVIPCLTGNMTWSLIRLGYQNDPRVQKAIEYITKYQRFDDGEGKRPTGWPYERFKSCFSKHTCHMGAIKALKALAEIPDDSRSKDVKETIKKGVEYFLIHHIHKRSHDLDKVAKPGWLKFRFPQTYPTDALEILGVLTKLGVKDPRMQEAMDVILSKQDDQGRWILESTFNSKFQVNIEVKGKSSKWITLNALRVIKRFYSPI
jgi:hypothetical protein